MISHELHAREPVCDIEASLTAAQAIDIVRVPVLDVMFGQYSDAHKTTFGATLTVDEFLERLYSVVATGKIQELFDWAFAKAERCFDISAFRALLMCTLDELEEHLHASELLMSNDRVKYRIIRTQIDRTMSCALARRSILGYEIHDATARALEDLIVKIDGADSATAEHSRAVSAWSSRIASRLGLSNQQTLYIARGGLIHDVGKVSTPPEILLKPGRLDDTERFVMQQHVIAGDDFLKSHIHLNQYRPMVRSHHERVDGRGYPDGIPSVELPIDVRIVTVADSFNAMIGRRPYKNRPFEARRAIEELQNHRGKQFDPEIVDVMVDLVTGEHDIQRE